MTDLVFHRLLWLYVALTVASTIASAFPQHSATLQAAAVAEPTSWLLEMAWFWAGVFPALMGTWLVGLVGLFRFRSWGRTLSLWSTMAALLIYPFIGSSLYWGVETALSDACSLVWGGILALAYFSPVSARFER